MVYGVESFQNYLFLQNLYRLQALGFEYIDHFDINQTDAHKQNATYATLVENVQQCHLCDLSKSRTQSMSGFGDPQSDLFILDYCVSSMQDSTNNYFAGRSGESLKNMIEKVLGLSVYDTYMTHAIKCKPLHNNPPSESEWNSCKGYLLSELAFVKPKVIMVLGKEAYSLLTGDGENFEEVRGHRVKFQNTILVPIYHPQYLLRNPELKKVTLGDLKMIKSCL